MKRGVVYQRESQLYCNWLDQAEFYSHIEELTLEEVNSNPMLTILIKTYIHRVASDIDQDETKMPARQLARDLLVNALNELYNNMPHATDRNTAGRMCLMGILKDASTKHKEAFKRLHITLPEE